MTDTITIDKNTPTDELMTAMELLLGRLIDRVGTGVTVGILFGTAVLMTVEDADHHV